MEKPDYIEEIVKGKPFTDEEELVSMNIIEVWKNFLKLEQTHDDERDDFRKAIHVLQGIMMNRVTRRDYPEFFTTVCDKKDIE